MEQEAYRHVPYDIDIEQALLGAILADNRAMERASALVKSACCIPAYSWL